MYVCMYTYASVHICIEMLKESEWCVYIYVSIK